MENQSEESNELNLNQAIEKLGETLDNLNSHACSIVSLSDQWQNIETSFAMAEASISAREKNLESRKKEIIAIEQRVEKLLSEMKIRQENLILREKNLSEKVKEVELMKKQMNEREKLLELWETEIDEKIVAMEKRRESEIDVEKPMMKSKEVKLKMMCEEMEVLHESIMEKLNRKNDDEIEEGEIWGFDDLEQN